MPAFRVTFTERGKERVQRVVADSDGLAAQEILGGGPGRQVVAVEADAPAPAPTSLDKMLETPVGELTALQLRGVIAGGVWRGLMIYAVIAGVICGIILILLSLE